MAESTAFARETTALMDTSRGADVVDIRARIHSTADAERLLGSSAQMLAVRRDVARARDSAAPVLIVGDVGTGRTLVAHCIHGGDGDPLVHVRCGAGEGAALDVLRAELEGSDRKARTLFLHGVEAMPVEAQIRLLGLIDLSRRHPQPLLRVIASTSVDLDRVSRAGRFRLDLLHRINTIVIRLPSLAMRGRADFDELLEVFAELQARRVTFKRKAADWLFHRGWSGNVRELRNVVERLAILSETTTIDVDILDDLVSQPMDATGSEPVERLVDAVLATPAPRSGRTASVELAMIERALAVAANETAAARLLGVPRRVMLRRRARLAKATPRDAGRHED